MVGGLGVGRRGVGVLFVLLLVVEFGFYVRVFGFGFSRMF